MVDWIGSILCGGVEPHKRSARAQFRTKLNAGHEGTLGLIRQKISTGTGLKENGMLRYYPKVKSSEDKPKSSDITFARLVLSCLFEATGDVKSGT